ncbi:MAG: late competence development ComFB family protein [Alicyclobacillaceae bacterium]|nr:late competence development ComFB family protein [Alicyclobacillaceae bacterium]
MQVVNLMEAMVRRVMDQVLGEQTDVCRCSKCLRDIMALSLNTLPPRYVSTRRGETFFKISQMENQFVADVLAAVAQAVEQVRKYPRHDSPEA